MWPREGVRGAPRGRAWVEANVVGGATFCVLLPDGGVGEWPGAAVA